jgi:hypothetical protein
MKTKREKPKAKDGSLTYKQIRAIPFLVTARSLEMGCAEAKISRSCLYKWLKNSAFRIELSTAREKLIAEALERLKTGLLGAVDGLLDFLDSNEKYLKMQACREVISHYFKTVEVEDLKRRIEILEEKMNG